MRKAFAGLSGLLMLVVVAEFFFAAGGAFGAGSGRDSYRPHHALGYVIFLLPLVMAVLAAFAKLPRLIGLAILVAALTGFQVAVAKFAKALGDTPGQLVFGLHALGGLAIVAAAGMIVRQAWALSRTETAGSGHRPR